MKLSHDDCRCVICERTWRYGEPPEHAAGCRYGRAGDDLDSIDEHIARDQGTTPADVEALIGRLQHFGGPRNDGRAAMSALDFVDAARLLIVYRSTLAWLATHDLTIGNGRRAQTIASKALNRGEAPEIPGAVRGRG